MHLVAFTVKARGGGSAGAYSVEKERVPLPIGAVVRARDEESAKIAVPG